MPPPTTPASAEVASISRAWPERPQKAADQDAPRSLRRARTLRPGDRVAVLSASSPVPQEPLERGIDQLVAAGLEPVVYASARDRGSVRPYLAGGDAMRADDLTDALLDRSIAGVLFARGGSGAGRTIARLDWSVLAAAAPKVLAGYSDVTAILEAVATRLGWASVHATMVAGTDPSSDTSFAALVRLLTDPAAVPVMRFPDAATVVGGVARGVTLGGNLCLLAASLGTPTSRPAAGGILMIEDESEEPYRLDRMLTHLHRAGYLDGVAGVICGRFHGCGPADEVDPVLHERLGTMGVPMITGADIGHGGPNQPFPIGIAAELDADAGTLRFLESPLTGGSARS